MSAAAPQAYIDGVGVLAPGWPDWATARAVLRGEQPWQSAPTVLPALDVLPPAERRRASRVVRAALGVGLQAVRHAQADAAQLATVFSASGADGDNCHALCEQLAGPDRQISPLRFHNSVHNAAAGYWGIATGAMAACQVLCAYDASFGAGLLEALAQVQCSGRPVLLVCYDSDYPEPLHAKRPTPDAAGVALLLAPQRSGASLAGLSAQCAGGVAGQAADTLADAGLEALRRDFPSLRALPLLQALAHSRAGCVRLDHLAPGTLQVELQPC